MTTNPLRVVLSGAAGQISYSLIPFLINGDIFGKDQKLELILYDITPMLQKLEGISMEIEDSASSLVTRLTCTDDGAVAFKEIDYAILVGGYPRKEGMLRSDLLAKNNPIFQQAAVFLRKYAKESTRVLVVANPANSNALILAKQSGLDDSNITALSRLDSNRATALLSKELCVDLNTLSSVNVWGNHSSTQVPDFEKACNQKMDSEKIGNLIEIIQKRGANVIKMRGASSALSAASAIRDHLRDWHFGTKGKTVSMCVSSNGNPFGIEEGLIFSFPVKIDLKGWRFDAEKKFTENLAERVRDSERELMEERSRVIRE